LTGANGEQGKESLIKDMILQVNPPSAPFGLSPAHPGFGP